VLPQTKTNQTPPRNFPIPRGNAFILKGFADVNHRPPHHAEVASQVHFFDLISIGNKIFG